MRRVSRSLTAKLTIAITAVSLVVFVVTSVVLSRQSSRMIKQEAAQRSGAVLNSTMQLVRNQLGVIETAVNSNAWLAEENYTAEGLESVARRLRWLNRNTYGVTVAAVPDAFADKGRYYSIFARMEGDSLIVQREPEYDYTAEEWYSAAIKAGKGVWAGMFNDETKGLVNPDRTLAIYTRPFYVNGQPAGVVSAGLSFRKLNELIHSANHPYPHAYFVILGGDGRYLIHPDSTRLFHKTIFADRDLTANKDAIALGHEMTAGRTGVAHLELNGALSHVGYAPIPGTDCSLALVCPESDIEKNYNRMLLFAMLFNLLGIVFIVLLCRWGVHRALAPISHLRDKAKRIAADHRNVETIEPSNRIDTVGRLQNSFAAMQQSIKRRLADIRQTTDEITRHNKELAYTTQMAEEAQRNKNLFVQNVMHQIRTPLNIIQGFAHVLRDEMEAAGGAAKMDKAEFDNISTMMKHNSQLLSRMVLMLYDSSETGLKEEYLLERNDEVAVNQLVRESIEFAHEHFPGIKVGIMTELDDGVVILTNHMYLMRTLRELLYNACKYSDGQHIQISAMQTADRVELAVTDTGPGVPHGDQDMIYEFFTKHDDLSEGLGLGLPLAKRHAISLGGNLTYDASYKEGARFVITMPK